MSTPVTSALQRAIGDAQHALDSHQLSRWLRGSGHLSGGPATAEIGLTVEVPGDAEVLLDGQTVAVDEFNNTADVTADDDRPRWSIISVQSDGSVVATDGEPRTLVGDDDQPAQVRNPAPPLEYPGVCYAAVFVPAGAAEVTADEILDRRLGASIRLGSVLADEIEGESVLADEIDIDEATVSNMIAEAATIDGTDSPYAQDPHEIGGGQHAADTLANLNSKVSDATLDDTGDPREPEAHSGTHENGGADEMSVAGLSGELADAQPSQTQDDGVDVVASPTLNFGNGLTVSDSAGTAQVDFDEADAGVESNIPNWEEDPNSPVTVSNETSVSITLDGVYQQILLFVSQDHDDRVVGKIRVNNIDTSDYNVRQVDGNQVVGVDAVPVSEAFFEHSFSMEMEGFVGGSWHCGNIGSVSSDVAEIAQHSKLSAQDLDSGPITSIQYFLDGANADDVNELTLQVYGRDVA